MVKITFNATKLFFQPTRALKPKPKQHTTHRTQPLMAVKLLCFLSLLLFSLSAAQNDLPTLLQLKSDWGNPQPLLSWNSTLPYCNWTGIGCTAGSVDSIILSNLNLTNPIPASICNLRNLTYLDLSSNDLPGPFPTSLYNCSSLSYLDLSENLFVGPIPSDIHRLSSSIYYLSLSYNNFSGEIPDSITHFPTLQTLGLDNNLFTGTLPPNIANLTKLQTLSLAYNYFIASYIPPNFGNLTALTSLWMSNMNLIGPIPYTFARLTKLEQLDLSTNNLTGTIPAEIWSFENLQTLYLYKNHLTGEIPATVRALQLSSIDVSINHLTGAIPDDFGKLNSLTGLAMYYNNLSGSIPPSIGLLPNLTNIRLFNNNLTGILPPELGKHSRLWNIEVDDNHLSGQLPDFLCAQQALTSVVVFDNNFTGELPVTIGNCPTLDNLQIHNNRFSGDVPAGIWSAVNITTVIMHNNALTGELPTQMPHNLSLLDIGSNRFTGSLPATAGNLAVFRAAKNMFSGKIQDELFTGMPKLQRLVLAGNQISGAIPDSVSSLRFLTDFNLSNNHLSGDIPAGIGDLPVLTLLDLSNNDLSGEIPPTFGNLRINELNLSSNHLSGNIPQSLLNPAYDNSFLANPGLCSLNCATPSSQRTAKFAVGLRVMILVLGAVLLLIGVIFAILAARVYRRKTAGGSLEAWKLTSFHTIDFRESNIVRELTDENEIGSGGSGKVYRVAIAGGKTVAVKKIWNGRKLDSKLEKEFQAEVQILGSIRHTNIVKLLCCVSSADSKLLVYEHMGNGSLDQWLHKRRQGEGGLYTPLDWKRRVAIAVGAAQGLCYMHHDCSPPIVHRDVKSSNILLDSAFGAKIADFGLARMLVKAGEADSVSGIAGSFGYMAPECGYLRKVNEKIDVYSFGVVLLELVTGREANDERDDDCLADWTWRQLQNGGKITDIIDEEIKDPMYMDEIEVVLRMGLICTGALPSDRPTMKEVLQVLLRCDPTKAETTNYKRQDSCRDVVPLLQPKRGSKKVKPSEDQHDDFGYDLENGSSG